MIRTQRLAKLAMAASVVALGGCGMMMSGPQTGMKHQKESVAELANAAHLHHFCGSRKCALHRFLANGPATVAVAHELHLGSWSPGAHHEGTSFAGNVMMTGGIAANPISPLGAVLFLLGAGQKGSLPAWADHYKWMRKGAETGEVVQVAEVYPLGADPRAASEAVAGKLGQKALNFLGTLKGLSGGVTQVSGSGYTQIWDHAGKEQIFVGTDEAGKNGNLSMVWWGGNALTGLGMVIMGEAESTFRLPRLGKLGHITKGQGSDYQLSRVECMPIPGDTGEGMAVATFMIEHPNHFTQSNAYGEAKRIFANQYLIMPKIENGNPVSGIFVWHEGKAQKVVVPILTK
ncbi:hypothetical protein JKG47_01045 [Acidithiobacillus sp. MC6.1]|nr:hypothetical protein [Acidithiobacillus sp. MC6.1]